MGEIKQIDIKNRTYYFYNNLLLYLASRLDFSDNKLNQYSHSFLYITKKVYNKKYIYKTPLLSAKLELFLMLIASFLHIYQK